MGFFTLDYFFIYTLITILSFQQQQEQSELHLLEIRLLRDRIKMLETDNASMNLKLSKNQKDIAQRLTEIEMQIGPEDTFEDDEDEGGMADEETSVFADEHLIGPGVVQSLTGSGSSSGNTDAGIQISSTNSNLVSIVMSSSKRNSGSFEEEDEKNRESFI